MKNLYTLLFTLCIFAFSFTQNLVLNPTFDDGFANWTAGYSSSYTAPTVITTDGHTGTNSVQYLNAAGTTGFYQNVAINGGTSYIISFWYKSTNTVNTADVTNARIWSYWLDAANSIVVDASTDAALKGPNNAYLTDQAAWTEYTATVAAPTAATQLQFAVRAYTGSTVSFDDFSLMNAATSGVDDIEAYQNAVKFNTRVRDNISFQLPERSTVNIYTLDGRLVSSDRVSDGDKVSMINSKAGNYIVQVTNGTATVSKKIIKE